MCYDDPLVEPDPESFAVKIDLPFTIFYTAEMTFKIIGGGFFVGREPYLSDGSNWLDGFVVIISLVGYAVATPTVEGKKKQEFGEPTGGSGLDGVAALRVFRVLRPLRAVSSIKGLRVLVSAVLNAIPMLVNTLIVLLFFFIMLAIGGQ
jgi:hypothetical protein